MAQRGVNKIILLGNVGGNPDCRSFNNGEMFAMFSLATTETWRDSNTGEIREKTEWHRCVCYRGLAGVVQQYVHKGSKLFIEGKLQNRKWTDQNGIERYSTEIIIENLQLLDQRPNNPSFEQHGQNFNQVPQFSQSQNYPPNPNFGQNPAYPPQAQNAPAPPINNPNPSENKEEAQQFKDDEIPF